jgi:hypothetical protein
VGGNEVAGLLALYGRLGISGLTVAAMYLGGVCCIRSTVLETGLYW